ncbi:MAG TPA: transglycosylase domain-containing protein [Acidimicrobiales bacterium]|nr:transglycosylase domain-containing protein [Acidimicrobiales bacterium]
MLFLATLLGFTAVAGTLYVLAQVPLPKEHEQAQTTFLTDVHGARLASFDSGENRVPIRLKAVPQVVVDAIVATEDRNFFTHGGIDPIGVVRATWADVRGRNLQGGSTLTQQYVKQTFLDTKERTIVRKLREASLAIKVERRYRKDEILERYLNTVYFGRGAYGVQAAARAYFDKDVADLDVGEAALLAGLIRSPETAEPSRNMKAAVRRRHLALRAMRRTGRITERQLDAAERVALDTAVVGRGELESDVVRPDSTGYFVEFVRAELVRRYGEEVTYQRGLRVKTTLDLGLQAQAFDAVYQTLDRPDTDPAGALVSIDSEGRVVAMVGGRNYTGVGRSAKVNLAVGHEGGGSGRQAGSTFKPFVLAAVVKAGFTVQSTFSGPPSIVLPKADNGRDYTVENYEKSDYGSGLSLIEATANSVNTAYVQAQLAVGAGKVVALAKEAGIRSELEPNASLVLGTEEVSVLELASAYSTFADRGVHLDPRTILEVRRGDGTVIEPERPAASTRVMDREDADVVNHVLRQVVERGSGTNAKIGKPVAGKTGTTQDFGDAWFVGYTPKLTTAVWMGYADGNTKKMTRVRGIKVNGGSFPARIFRRYMTEVTKDPQYVADFATVTKFPGKKLAPPKNVVIPTSSTTSTSVDSNATSTTMAPTSTSTASTTTTAAP